MTEHAYDVTTSYTGWSTFSCTPTRLDSGSIYSPHSTVPISSQSAGTAAAHVVLISSRWAGLIELTVNDSSGLDTNSQGEKGSARTLEHFVSSIHRLCGELSHSPGCVYRTKEHLRIA